jgi:DNA invertase Pin-like site-specific DNA recombinase
LPPVPTGLLNFEGIVSKRLTAPYRSGPSRDWIKVKNLTADIERSAGSTAFSRSECRNSNDADRPQLKRLLQRLETGDVVIITAVDRLSRDTTDLLVLARQMQRAGAGLRSLAEPLVDTTSEFSDLVLAVLGLAAKLERRRILERTARRQTASAFPRLDGIVLSARGR